MSYDRNNNPGMVSDLVGDEDIDDYYGEQYGDETEYKAKEPEGNYDFMWVSSTLLPGCVLVLVN